MAMDSVRQQTLTAAAQCVLQDRNAAYGSVEDNFKNIASLWSAYKDVPFTAVDVALMMSLMKIARLKHNPTHFDSYVDLAGYAACGAEASHGK
jgi:hypothetical protein